MSMIGPMRTILAAALAALMLASPLVAQESSEKGKTDPPKELTLQEKLDLAQLRIQTIVAENTVLQKRIEVMEAQLQEAQIKQALGGMFSRLTSEKGAEGRDCGLTLTGEWTCSDPPKDGEE